MFCSSLLVIDVICVAVVVVAVVHQVLGWLSRFVWGWLVIDDVACGEL